MEETERKVIVALEERYRAHYCILVKGDMPDDRIIDLLDEAYTNGTWTTNAVSDSEGVGSYSIEIVNKTPEAMIKPEFTIGPDPEEIVHKVTLTENGVTTVIFEGKGEDAYDRCSELMDLLKKDDRIRYSSSNDDPAIKGSGANETASMTPAVWVMTEKNFEYLRNNWSKTKTEEHYCLGSVVIGSIDMEFLTREDGGDTILHTTNNKEWQGPGTIDKDPLDYYEDGTPIFEIDVSTHNEAVERAIKKNSTFSEFKKAVEDWLRKEFPKETSAPSVAKLYYSPILVKNWSHKN